MPEPIRYDDAKVASVGPPEHSGKSALLDLLERAIGVMYGDGGYTNEQAEMAREIADFLGEPFTVFVCPACEWAATTGAAWDRCPHCDTLRAPKAREVVFANRG